jgi:hypothetical protein
LPEAEASLREDLRAVRLTAAPLLQDLDLDGPLGAERYRMLVLPHGADGRTVQELLILLRPRPLSAASLPEWSSPVTGWEEL